ncbi:hypothetical protein ACFQX7_06790 [Luedemannella flava]
MAVIPRLARTSLPAGVAVVPVEPVPTRRVGVAWRTASGARPAINAAIEALHHAWRHRATG